MVMYYFVVVLGRLGFKGSRKGTPFAASQIAANLSKRYGSNGN